MFPAVIDDDIQAHARILLSKFKSTDLLQVKFSFGVILQFDKFFIFILSWGSP